MVHSAISFTWILLCLCCISVSAAPLAPVRRDAVTSTPSSTREPAPPSAYFTPTNPISRRYTTSRIAARSADDAQVLNFLRKRELFIVMLNGGPVESRFVNLLDLWHMAEKAIERTPADTPRHTELVDFQLTTATKLTKLMEGVASLQSSVAGPSPTPESEGQVFTDVDTETTSTEGRPSPTSSANPESSSQSSSESSPTPTTEILRISSRVAQPAPTVTPESVPAPAPQPPNPEPANGGVANGSPSSVASPNGPAGVTGTVSSASGLAEAAQATETINADAGSAMGIVRFSGKSWMVVGAALVLSAGIL